MWNNFKNKLKQFLEPEDEHNYAPKKDSSVRKRQDNQEQKESVANTRMTYKYPKQGNFRFPVIPDHNETKEKPAHRERPPRRYNRSYQSPDHSESYKRKKTTPKKEEKPETESTPFTPTNVPSPVYGFHPRNTPKSNAERLFGPREETGKTASMEQARLDEEHWQSIRQRVLNTKSNMGELPPQEEAPSQTSSMEQARLDEEHWQAIRQRVLGKIGSKKEKQLANKENEEIDEDIAREEIEDAARETAASVTEEDEKLQIEDKQESVSEPAENDWPLDTEEVHEENSYEPDSSSPLTSKEETEHEETAEEVPLETDYEEVPREVVQVEEEEQEEQEEQETVPKTEINESPAFSRKPRARTTERKSVPFNVLMTPRDKRTRDSQKKTLNRELSRREEQPPVQKTEQKKQNSTPLHLLNDKVRAASIDDSWVKGQMELLETTLRQFHVRAKVIHAMKGPAVTRFEVQPEPGVKVSKITNLADDIKLSMAARDIRIEAPIPGKQAVGIEVPNQKPEMVGLQEILESEAFNQEDSPLTVGLGLDIGGDAVVTNLKKMPHGLIAGATGSGKSVCINTILISMLYKAHHDDVKFLLIDPKMVELAPYNGLPHLVSPVITDVKAATTALKWAVKEMEERYEKFVAEGARDVERYNEKMIRQGRTSEKLPYLVIVIDELADLMMVSPQDVEDSICRIAQKARACGIHLLLATQRPSVDVITGLIKANIPTRIAFSVSSQVDSRTIIDSGGAEKLLGKGDMLFIENGSGRSLRIQGAFVSDDEIERITGYVKKIAPPNYLFEQDELIKQVTTEEETDDLFDEAVEFVVEHNGASASLLQRRFKVGYNRAARLIDQMAEYGIISEAKGSKPRDILLTRQQVEEIKAR
ncbi:DNA translocase FtsK [Halobacillus sp. Marseille-Q1614]|uniref:DNA translocase FtsK n=1 Tax=Halobacillus sp. Marseille-Q1614 TaxID=2709134 RepID=UPI0015702E0F|nr:DNA translocase FtsK [Halobacillus sp. Marseille-Q1614]